MMAHSSAMVLIAACIICMAAAIASRRKSEMLSRCGIQTSMAMFPAFELECIPTVTLVFSLFAPSPISIRSVSITSLISSGIETVYSREARARRFGREVGR